MPNFPLFISPSLSDFFLTSDPDDKPQRLVRNVDTTKHKCDDSERHHYIENTIKNKKYLLIY